MPWMYEEGGKRASEGRGREEDRPLFTSLCCLPKTLTATQERWRKEAAGTGRR